MNKRQIISKGVIVLLVIVVGYVVIKNRPLSANEYKALEQEHRRKADEMKLELIKDVYRKQDKLFSFYGKVVDQYGGPVKGANVSGHVMHFCPDAEEFFGKATQFQRVTDDKGFFSVENQTGRSIYIDNISRDNYDNSQLRKQKVHFEYSVNGDQKPFVADKNSPVVFKLRKQSETAFCIESPYWGIQILTKESGQTKGHDFISQTPIRNLAKPVLNGQPLTCDIKLKATYDAKNSTWSAVLLPGDADGGIIVLDKLLYEAPSTGYQPKYAFTATKSFDAAKEKYIYLKSRNPSIYTCVMLEHVGATPDFFNLSGKVVTNPYGDRNLECATNLPYEITRQLEDEAKKAFRQNKRPVKPDILKLVKF